MNTYYFSYNQTTGQISGIGVTPDGTVPSTAIVCTQAQSQNWQQYAINLATTPPSIVSAPTSVLLAQSQITQIGILAGDYLNAIAQPVSFTTAAGVVKTYQADKVSVQNLIEMTLTFTKAGATPTGFYWVAQDSTQVPFAFADLQNLAAAIGAPGVVAYQHLQTLKADVLAATTVTAVQAVVW